MYDTIVIGNDFSSVVAAVTSVRYGHKTILLSDTPPPLCQNESCYSFNVHPLPLTGLGPGDMLSDLLSGIGISFDNDDNLHLLSPALQVILPNHRIDLFDDIPKFMEEIRREFPQTEVEIPNLAPDLARIGNITDEWFREILVDTPRCYRRFNSSIRIFREILKRVIPLSRLFLTLYRHRELQQLYKGKLYLLSGSDIDRNAFFPRVMPYILSLSNRKFYDYTGGIAGLIDFVRNIFSSYGGILIKNAHICRITPGAEISVTLEGAEEMSEITGRNLIISTRSDSLPILLDSKKTSGIKRRLRRIKKPYYPFTLHMGILDKGIPEKMSPFVAIAIDEHKDIIDNNMVFVSMSARNDTTRAPVNKRALSATVFLADSPLSLGDTELTRWSEHIIKHLEAVIPFLKENIDYFDLDSSIKLSREHNLISQRYMIPADFRFGINDILPGGFSRNIYLTGDMLPPGLGCEGEIISGMRAAFSTIKMERKNHGSNTI
jgi:phytoene dehydrogenase-like protein